MSARRENFLLAVAAFFQGAFAYIPLPLIHFGILPAAFMRPTRTLQ
jgi:hypothetical protein